MVDHGTFDTLVIGPQHGICREGLTGSNASRLDSSWTGIYPGEASLLCDHIQRSVEVAARHPSALLVFSGGDTKPSLPGRSEAQSAYEIARDHQWFGYPGVAERCHLEIHARCSAQNLMFSAFLYRRLTMRFPARVIVVGWGFKGTRFAAHASALSFMAQTLEYLGVNNPPAANFASAFAGEVSKLHAMMTTKDLLLSGANWGAQRSARNPRDVKHPYDEEIAAFLV